MAVSPPLNSRISLSDRASVSDRSSVLRVLQINLEFSKPTVFAKPPTAAWNGFPVSQTYRSRSSLTNFCLMSARVRWKSG